MGGFTFKLKKTALLLATVSMPLSMSVSAHEGEDHGLKRITMGSFTTTETGLAKGFDISGRAMLVRGSSTTQAYTQVIGLNADTSYGSHVHDLPCDVEAGGGHYKIDPSVESAEADNEIWPALVTDANGVGYGEDMVDHVARPEAQSIVVHDADGTRLACADLKADNDGAVVSEGLFNDYASAAELGYAEISGQAQLVRSNNRTYATANLTGLNPSLTYMTHVHNLPCDVSNGGSHYEIDPTVEEVIESNEIWPVVTTDEFGVGTGSVSVGHVARPEAQSIVVHNAGGERIACANLVTPRDWMLTRGYPITFPGGVTMGYDVDGFATMSRMPTDKTKIVLKVSGLLQNTTYPAHVHDMPCSMGGGAHYKIDASVEGTEEANEIWPVVKTDAKGVAKATIQVNHLARPEAQSIVIHEPTDTSIRLACYDLD